MTKELIEIQKILRSRSSENVKKSFEKFIPSEQKIYGVKVPQLNELAKKFKIWKQINEWMNMKDILRNKHTKNPF